MLGKKIRAARDAAKMSQEQLAERSGLHLNTIKGFERGLTPSRASFEAISKALPTLCSEMPVAPEEKASSGEWEIRFVVGAGNGRNYEVTVRPAKERRG